MRKRKTIAIAVAACALALACAGGALAWLSVTGVLVNTFGIGTVTPTVEESLNGAVKSDVHVKNDGTAPMYLRAEVDIYWQDADGNRLWEEPQVGTDYEITWGSAVAGSATAGADGSGVWRQDANGYWYWSLSVAPGEQTGQLIESVTQLGTPADGKRLVVDIVTQAVQSSPDDAVYAAWGYSASNGVITSTAASAEGE